MSFMSKQTSVLISEMTSLWNMVNRVGVLFIEVSSVQGVCSKRDTTTVLLVKGQRSLQCL